MPVGYACLGDQSIWDFVQKGTCSRADHWSEVAATSARGMLHLRRHKITGLRAFRRRSSPFVHAQPRIGVRRRGKKADPFYDLPAPAGQSGRPGAVDRHPAFPCATGGSRIEDRYLIGSDGAEPPQNRSRGSAGLIDRSVAFFATRSKPRGWGQALGIHGSATSNSSNLRQSVPGRAFRCFHRESDFAGRDIQRIKPIPRMSRRIIASGRDFAPRSLIATPQNACPKWTFCPWRRVRGSARHHVHHVHLSALPAFRRNSTARAHKLKRAPQVLRGSRIESERYGGWPVGTHHGKGETDQNTNAILIHPSRRRGFARQARS